MDGIAFSFAAWEKGQRRFAIQGIHKAGDKPRQVADASKCWEVMTGAVMPTGADCIAPVESIEVDDGFATILEPTVKKSITPFRHVHRAGGDGRLHATGSGDFSGWSKADGFVEIAPLTNEAPAGSRQFFWRW